MQNKIVLATAWYKNNKQDSYTLCSVQKHIHCDASGKWHPSRTKFGANYIEPELIDINDIYELADAINDVCLGNTKPKTLVYGHLSDHAQDQIDSSNNIIKRHSSLRHGDKGTFVDRPQNWHCLDIDSIILPSDYNVSMPLETLGNWLINTVFPEELQDITYVICATGSHGCIHKKGADNIPRLRIFLWLKDACTIAEFKDYVDNRLIPYIGANHKFIGRTAIDNSIYSESHYIFIAPPVIEYGDGQPYEHKRIAIIEGWKNEVKIPEYEKLEQLHPENINTALGIRPNQAQSIKYKGSNEELLAKIASGSHEPIRVLMARFGKMFGEGQALHNAIEDIKPQIIARIRETSSSTAEFERRCREEVASDALYKSAVAFARKVDGLGKKAVTPKIDVFEEKTPLDTLRAKWKIKIRNLIDKALFGNEHIAALLKIVTGFGKTYLTLNTIDDDAINNFIIAYYAPNHKLSEQTYNDLKVMKPNVADKIYHVKGRKQDGMCISKHYGALCDQMEQIGLSARATVCNKLCDKKHVCPWIAQKQKMKSGQPGVYCMTHADITSTMAHVKSAKRIPKLSIIDEDAICTILQNAQIVCELDMLNPDHFQQYIKFKDRTWWARSNDWHTYRTKILKGLNRKTQRQKCTQFPGDMDYNDAIKCEYLLLNELLKKTENITNERELEATDFKKIGAIINACHTMINCYKAVRASKKNKYRQYVAGIRIIDSTLDVMIKPELPPAITKTSLICLDATANKKLWQIMFANNKNQTVHEIDVPPGEYKLTQCMSQSFSLSRLLGRYQRNKISQRSAASNMHKLKRIICDRAFYYNNKDRIHGCVASDGRNIDVLVIAQKQIEDQLLPLPENVDTAHFQNLKGLNRYSNIPCIIVIGRPMPPMDYIERLTESIYYDDGNIGDIQENGVYTKRKAKIHTRSRKDGALGAWEIEIHGHNNELCNDIIELITDAEVKQAIGRGRIVGRKEGNALELLIFGQIDTGLPIDKEIQFDRADASISQLMQKRGIITLNTKAARDFYSYLLPENERSQRAFQQKTLKKIDLDKILEKGNWEKINYKTNNRVGKLLIDNKKWTKGQINGELRLFVVKKSYR